MASISMAFIPENIKIFVIVPREIRLYAGNTPITIKYRATMYTPVLRSIQQQNFRTFKWRMLSQILYTQFWQGIQQQQKLSKQPILRFKLLFVYFYPQFHRRMFLDAKLFTFSVKICTQLLLFKLNYKLSRISSKWHTRTSRSALNKTYLPGRNLYSPAFVVYILYAYNKWSYSTNPTHAIVSCSYVHHMQR